MKEKKGTRAERGVPARRRKSVSGKLATAIVLSVIVAVVVLLVVVYVKMSRQLLEQSEELLQTTTERTLRETEAWMNKTLTMLEVQRDTIQYQNMDISQIRDYVKHTENQNDAYPAGLYVASNNGSLYHASFVPGPDYDPLTKGWYQDGLKSDHFIFGDVYLDEASNSYVVAASCALKNDVGSIRGVAAADVYLDSISNIVSDTRLEETGGIFLVDIGTGFIIGHPDKSLVGKKLSELSTGIYPYAAQQVQSKNTGLFLHDNIYVQVSLVPNSNWAAVTYVSRAEVLQDLMNLTVTMAGIALVAIVVLILLVLIQVRRIIGVPVAELSQVATSIAQGDLEQTIHYHSQDELGILADNFNQVTLRLRDYVRYINEISDTLHEIANGNLTFTLQNDYAGEFAKIKTSLDEISYSLNGAMGQIRTASREVALGAEQVSGSAMQLSQGSTEQAAAVESLADHIGSVSGSVQMTADNAQEASRISQDVKRGLLESNEKMQNMTDVIRKISDNSTEIHKIVKTIEDIAFQTNILALNAAVEAARAGTAGKGFAVVADEVRNLAGKSSAAAQETTVLLSQTVASMDEGVQAAQDTAQSMLAVVAQADEMSGLIAGIADRTRQQAADTEEITTGIDQISSVVQNNVATTEASAAASEELSGQADLLKELVARFQLKAM